MDISGGVEQASMSYIIRDHSKELFEAKKAKIFEITEALNAKYGEGTVIANVSDSYLNMREKIVPEYQFLIDAAKETMEALDIEPKITPVRGGTDGAKLSYMGLPCPNLCTGGHNFHGRYEFICVESMRKIVELLIKLAADIHKYCNE